jgi:Tol biopolymer transport system component
MLTVRRFVRLGVAVPLVGLVVNACGGGDVTAPPGSSGTLQVTTVTSGAEQDPDGYSIQIDGGAATAMGNAETRTFSDVASGDHSVQLGGMAANCAVTDNPRPVIISAGGTASITFTVSCASTTGGLSITATTGGSNPDADGYTIVVDGAERGSLGANATVAVSGVPSGVHAVGLTGVAANCQIQGDNIRSVTVAPGADASVAYTINCAAPPAGAGSLKISTATSGSGSDADGYTFAVDGGKSTPIGPSATTTLQNLAPGPHNVQLDGLSGNCAVQGSNPKSATVAAGASAEVSFTVTCSAGTPTSGSIKVTTATSGAALDPNGYTVSVDGGSPRTIGVNESVTLENISTGDHSVALAGAASNCTVADNPRTTTVTAGNTAQVAFQVNCSAAAKIAFTGTGGGIKVVNPDGSGQVEISAQGLYPQWSRDRSKIAFDASEDLYVMNRDGTGRTQLTTDLWFRGLQFRWSPDGSRVAGTAYDCPRDADECNIMSIWIVRADGSGSTRLTAGAEPSWSPDGRTIAFSNEGQIYTVSSDGRDVTGLSPIAAGYSPVWSPDGTRIAFLRTSTPSSADVLVMNRDGTGTVNLTQGRGLNVDPTWSPDGSRLAFWTSSTPTQHARVRVFKPDGSGEVMSVQDSWDNYTPTWSPDGRQLAFVKLMDGIYSDIYVVDAAGGVPTNVTNTPDSGDLDPAWASR